MVSNLGLLREGMEAYVRMYLCINIFFHRNQAMRMSRQASQRSNVEKSKQASSKLGR